VSDPVQQDVQAITFPAPYGQIGEYEINLDGVTHIEQVNRPGLHCDIPYLRVWKDDVCLAELSQHGVIHVRFVDPTPPAPLVMPPDHTGEPSCTCFECIPF
jgi:hypothetical protein